MTGRPTTYSPGLASLICDRIARGESLLKICAEKDMPSQSMVYRWLEKHHAFRERYARARELQCDSLADEALEVTRNGKANMANANRVRLDAIKWFAAKVAPKKYGEKVQHTGDGGGPIKREERVDLTPESIALLDKMIFGKGP